MNPTLNDLVKSAFEQALQVAEAMGRDAGEQAGHWVTDGNTTMRTYQMLLTGIEEGDPEILDLLPHADTSATIVESLVLDLVDETGAWTADWLNDVLDAYAYGFAGGVQDAIVADCQYHLAPELEEC